MGERSAQEAQAQRKRWGKRTEGLREMRHLSPNVFFVLLYEIR